jgi:hypothetical protein
MAENGSAFLKLIKEVGDRNEVTGHVHIIAEARLDARHRSRRQVQIDNAFLTALDPRPAPAPLPLAPCLPRPPAPVRRSCYVRFGTPRGSPAYDQRRSHPTRMALTDWKLCQLVLQSRPR